MKQVEGDSQGKVALGPGTLYGAIKRMLEAQLIVEVPGDNQRRKYYELTALGKKSLSAELKRYKEAVDLATKENLFEGLGFSV
jgi:DNA-binding PadR family transcriptional regulator